MIILILWLKIMTLNVAILSIKRVYNILGGNYGRKL